MHSLFVECPKSKYHTSCPLQVGETKAGDMKWYDRGTQSGFVVEPGIFVVEPGIASLVA